MTEFFNQIMMYDRSCANGTIAEVTAADQLALLRATKSAVSPQHAFAIVRAYDGGRFSFVTSNDVQVRDFWNSVSSTPRYCIIYFSDLV